jgi:hypothetical protein
MTMIDTTTAPRRSLRFRCLACLREELDRVDAPGVTFEDGMARMRSALARLERGERMSHPSPWLGPLTHDQWIRINLSHTQMHLGFMTYADAEDGRPGVR